MDLKVRSVSRHNSYSLKLLRVMTYRVLDILSKNTISFIIYFVKKQHRRDSQVVI